MITALAQTLAEILAGGTSLTSTEQIGFSHPADLGTAVEAQGFNIYCFDIRENSQVQQSGRQVVPRSSQDVRFGADERLVAGITAQPCWFDVSFLVTARDRTTLGEQHLLGEGLALLLRHRQLREELLAPTLRGYGNLSLAVCAPQPVVEPSALWAAIGTALRAALVVTITAPIVPYAPVPVPVVWERVTRLRAGEGEDALAEAVRSRRVAIAGVVKGADTALPLQAAQVALAGTEKTAVSNQEGLFFFENLRLGHYVLELSCPGYLPQKCNVLVDSQNYMFKEIALTPK